MMANDVENIQKMMRELVIISVEKINKDILDNCKYNDGISLAYSCTLSSLYNQAKLSGIPLNYLSLHTLDPEKASFSKEIVKFDGSLPIPKVKEKYKNSMLFWLEDNIFFIKERYEDNLAESIHDKFYKAIVDGYKEIFALMEKYGIKVI